MADEKKPEAKPAVKSDTDMFAEIAFMVVGLLFFIAVVNGIAERINSGQFFPAGWSGFTARGVLLAHTRPISSLLNPVDTNVVSVNETEVYDGPGGEEIGFHRPNARGKILQGPVYVGGENYYYVDFDRGEDGWVKEHDIAYLESEPNFFEKVVMFISLSMRHFKWLILLFCIACGIATYYLIRHLTELRISEKGMLYPAQTVAAPMVNEGWENIVKHLNSPSESDWRLAILEADIMLSGLLDALFLPGESIGDKLKAVEKSDFLTLDNAWEAHKIRNQIAHDGKKFILTEREAKRVISLYQSVFEEFSII